MYGKFSPIARSGHPKLKIGSKAYDDYWDEQQHYILKGYSIGGEYITGSFYHFLNYSFVKDKYRQFVNPFYVDVDKEFFDTLEECRKDEYDFIVFKAREKGFTQFLASEANRIVHNMQNCECAFGFPSAESPAEKSFLSKFIDNESAYPKALKQIPYFQAKSFENRQYHYFEQTVKDKDSEKCGIQTSIQVKRVTDKDIFKSSRYVFMGLDELGELNDPAELYLENTANMRWGDEKLGPIVLGGTSNTMKQGYAQALDMFLNPEKYGRLRTMFIPGKRKYFPFVDLETGKSLEVQALIALKKKEEGMSKENLLKHRQNYPDKISDILAISDNSLLDQVKLASQEEYLSTEESVKGLIQRYTLVEHGDKVDAILDENGNFEILAMPRKQSGNEMFYTPDSIGVDSVYKEEAPTSESLCSIVVYRPYISPHIKGQYPVCIYHHRYKEDGGKNKSKFYNDLYLCCKFYNTRALVEDTDSQLFDWFEQRNLTYKWLQPEPDDPTIPFNKTAKRKFGVKPNNQDVLRASNTLLKDYVDEHCGNIMFIRMIKDLKKFGIGRKNSDIGDAFKWALLQAQRSVKVAPEIMDNYKPKNSLPLPIKSNGKTLDWSLNYKSELQRQVEARNQFYAPKN
jgi:hypothetical protein